MKKPYFSKTERISGADPGSLSAQHVFYLACGKAALCESCLAEKKISV